MCVCVCVCARARARVCVCVCVCVRKRAYEPDMSVAVPNFKETKETITTHDSTGNEP